MTNDDTRTEIARRLEIARSEKQRAEQSGFDRDALRLDGAVGVLENLLEDIDIAQGASPANLCGNTVHCATCEAAKEFKP